MILVTMPGHQLLKSRGIAVFSRPRQIGIVIAGTIAAIHPYHKTPPRCIGLSRTGHNCTTFDLQSANLPCYSLTTR